MRRRGANFVLTTAPAVALLLAALSLMLAAPPAVAVTAPEVLSTERAETRLIAEVDALLPGEPATVALRTRLRPGWHSYWINPGDSGEPAMIRWSAPDGVSVSPIDWPTPVRFLTSGIVSFGYKTEVVLPMRVETPEDWPIGVPVELTADATWLVCSDEICIPERQTFTLSIPTAPVVVADVETAEIVAAARAARPTEIETTAEWRERDDRFLLDLPLPELAGAEDVFFFPEAWGVVDHSAPQTVARTETGVRVDVPRGDGPVSGEVRGVLTARDRSSGETVRIALALTATPGVGVGLAATPVGADAGGGGFGGGPSIGPLGAEAGLAGALLALVFAFAGGAILNLMPCVFPVLALKAVSLAKHADAEQRARLYQGVAYGAGVLVSFLAFAALLIGLKTAGAAVGWGFQLQTPIVVAALAYILFAVGLNLSGVFELPSSYAGVGDALTKREGTTGAFFTGVLAAVVASPCTAPFMGAALGYALTQNAAVTLLVFAALAAGFAAPIIALSASPRLGRALPRPGPWMTRFRQALAFPMYAAAAWLLWVLGGQVGVDALFAALIGLILVALAAWALGVGAPASVSGRRAAAAVAVAASIGAAAALQPSLSDDGAAPARAADAAAEPAAAIDGAAYSPERLAALRAEGRSVFLNLTADWCISCKVNERLVLRGDAFRAALEDADAVYLVGDWTRRDPAITAVLESFGRVGVPLYVVYPGDGSAPRVLPQILTNTIVADALTGA